MTFSFEARSGSFPADPGRENTPLLRTGDDLLRSEGVDPEGFALRPNVAIWKKTRNFSLPLMETPAEAKLTPEQVEALLGDYIAAPPPPRDETILVAPMGDQQFGKMDGDGTPGAVARYRRGLAGVRDRVERDHDGLVHTIVLAQLGDLLEGCVSQGGRLATRLDLSVPEQLVTAQEMFLDSIKVLAPLTHRLVIPVVGGNHDEYSRQFATSPGKNFATAAALLAANAVELWGGANHVQFIIQAAEERTLGVDLGERYPIRIGLTHGDVVNRPEAMPGYWKEQIAGEQPIAGSRVVLNGHFHHLMAKAFSKDLYWIQLPAMDGGSGWYRTRKADDLTSAMLSFLLTPTKRIPIDRIEFHE